MKTTGTILAPSLALWGYVLFGERYRQGIDVGEAIRILFVVSVISLPIIFLTKYANKGGMKADGLAEWILRLAIWMTVGIHLGLALLEDGLGVDTSCFRQVYDGNPPILKTVAEGICFGGLAGLAANAGAAVGAMYDQRKFRRRASLSTTSVRG